MVVSDENFQHTISLKNAGYLEGSFEYHPTRSQPSQNPPQNPVFPTDTVFQPGRSCRASYWPLNRHGPDVLFGGLIWNGWHGPTGSIFRLYLGSKVRPIDRSRGLRTKPLLPVVQDQRAGLASSP